MQKNWWQTAQIWNEILFSIIIFFFLPCYCQSLITENPVAPGGSSKSKSTQHVFLLSSVSVADRFSDCLSGCCCSNRRNKPPSSCPSLFNKTHSNMAAAWNAGKPPLDLIMYLCYKKAGLVFFFLHFCDWPLSFLWETPAPVSSSPFSPERGIHYNNSSHIPHKVRSLVLSVSLTASTAS